MIFFKFKNIWTGKHIMEIKKGKSCLNNTQNNFLSMQLL